MLKVKYDIYNVPELDISKKIRRREEVRRQRRRWREEQRSREFQRQTAETIHQYFDRDNLFQELEFTNRRPDEAYRLLNGLEVVVGGVTFNFTRYGYRLKYSRGEVDTLKFYQCKRLKSIIFEQPVVIYANAFQECGVTSVTFKQYAELFDGAFLNSNVETVTFDKYCKIGNFAFRGCTALRKVVFHGVSNIEPNSFDRNVNLIYTRRRTQTGRQTKRQRRLRL